VAEEAVDRVFARSEPQVRALAGALIRRLGQWQSVRVDAKGGSIHLCRKSAFAGLHPRRSALLLNLRTSEPIESGRVRRVERVSANRFHNELLLAAPEELDDELFAWLADACALAG